MSQITAQDLVDEAKKLYDPLPNSLATIDDQNLVRDTFKALQRIVNLQNLTKAEKKLADAKFQLLQANQEIEVYRKALQK